MIDSNLNNFFYCLYIRFDEGLLQRWSLEQSMHDADLVNTQFVQGLMSNAYTFVVAK
jgi:hypothetical protein